MAFAEVNGADPTVSKFSLAGAEEVGFTGALNFNLPLMNVPGRGGLSFPLSLAYESGVRVFDEATWVGLGWNLNFPRITRSVSGYPDEWRMGAWGNKNADASLSVYVSNDPKATLGVEFFYKDGSIGVPGQFLTGTAEMDVSAESHTSVSVNPQALDSFYLIGTSGAGGRMLYKLDDFIMDEDDAGNVNFFLENWAPIKIEPVMENFLFEARSNEQISGVEIKQWKVTMSDGSVYVFGDGSSFGEDYADYNSATKTKTYSKTLGCNIAGDRVLASTDYPDENCFNYPQLQVMQDGFLGPQDHRLESTTWFLTEIHSPDYVDVNDNGADEDDKGNWIKFNWKKWSNKPFIYWGEWIPFTMSGVKNPSTGKVENTIMMYSNKETVMQVNVIDSIETPTHKAEFVVEDRQDLPESLYPHMIEDDLIPEKRKNDYSIELYDKRGYDDERKYLPRLAEIKLINKNNNEMVSKIVLGHDYRLKKHVVDTSDITKFPFDFNMAEEWNYGGSLTLSSVTQYGKDGGNLPPTRFEYEEVLNPNMYFDAINSIDRWGYYNGAKKPDIFKKKYVSNQDGSAYLDTSVLTAAELFDYKFRYSNDNSKAWSLRKIIYPTGAEKIIDYETNYMFFSFEGPGGFAAIGNPNDIAHRGRDLRDVKDNAPTEPIYYENVADRAGLLTADDNYFDYFRDYPQTSIYHSDVYDKLMLALIGEAPNPRRFYEEWDAGALDGVISPFVKGLAGNGPRVKEITTYDGMPEDDGKQHRFTTNYEYTDKIPYMGIKLAEGLVGISGAYQTIYHVFNVNDAIETDINEIIPEYETESGTVQYVPGYKEYRAGNTISAHRDYGFGYMKVTQVLPGDYGKISTYYTTTVEHPDEDFYMWEDWGSYGWDEGTGSYSGGESYGITNIDEYPHALTSRANKRGFVYKVEYIDKDGNIVQKIENDRTFNEKYVGTFKDPTFVDLTKINEIPIHWKLPSDFVKRTVAKTTLDGVTTKTETEFNDNALPYLSVEYGNDGKKRISKTIYAYEQSPILDLIRAKNMLSLPYESLVYEDYVSVFDANLKSKSVIEYDNFDIEGDVRIYPSAQKQWLKEENRYITSTFVEYDKYGNLLTVRDPLGYETKTEYDEEYNSALPTKVINALLHEIETIYDEILLLPVEIKDVDNDLVTKYNYDEFGRLVSVQQPDEDFASTLYGYDLTEIPNRIATVQKMFYEK